jgi:hypothetical protein
MADPTSPNTLKLTPATPIKLTWEEWVAKFKPIQNPFCSRDEDGFMFETFGEEHQFVVDKSCEQNGNAYVWTQVSEDEYMGITDGYHYVNRMGYYVTEVPCEPDHCYEIVLAEARFQARFWQGSAFVVIDTEQDGKAVCFVDLAQVNGYQIAETIADALTAQNREDELDFDLTREDDEDADESLLELDSSGG